MSSGQQKLANVQFKGHCACTKGLFHTLDQQSLSQEKVTPAEAQLEIDEHQEYLRRLKMHKKKSRVQYKLGAIFVLV